MKTDDTYHRKKEVKSIIEEGADLKRICLITALLCGCMLSSTYLLSQVQAAESAVDERVNIYFDNNQLAVRTLSSAANDDVYVQARTFLEGMGFRISWNEDERKVVAKKDTLELAIDIELKNALINGFMIEKPVIMEHDSLFLPVREVAASMGYKVKVDNRKQNFYIANEIDPFREFDWNTGIDEIKLRSKDSKELTDLGYVVAYDDYHVFNYSSQVYYHFKEKKLKEITYRIKDKEESFERFSRIRYELERIYGKPDHDEPYFVNEESYQSFVNQVKDRSEDEAADILYKTIVNGDVFLGAEWKAGGFTVHLMLSSSGTSKKNTTFIDVSIRENRFVFTGKE